MNNADEQDITRFDIPVTVRCVLETAMGYHVIDAMDIYGMAVKHGDNWGDLVNEVCEVAFTLTSSPSGQWVHAEVVALAEHFWRTQLKEVVGKPIDRLDRQSEPEEEPAGPAQ